MAEDIIPGDGVCYVPGCERWIRTGLLMCAPHWSKVPEHERSAVLVALGAWEVGTGTLGDLRDAQGAAVRAVQEAWPKASP